MFDVKKITNADVNMLYITEIKKLKDDKIYLEAGICGYNNVNGEQQGVLEKIRYVRYFW